MKIFSEYTPKQKIVIYSILAIFALVYASISLINHYSFRTFAYDLGIYNNMLYSYAHLKANYTSLQQPMVNHAFADHFEPIFFLFAPLYYIFGSYTLLVIQIFFVLFGGVGILYFTKSHSNNQYLSIAVLVQFFAMWGVYSALAFDFHNNVTAAMLVPWFLVFAHQQKYKLLLLVWALMLLTKENMALYTVFICAGAALHFFKIKKLRNILSVLSVCAAIYFVLIVKVVIPLFQTEDAGYIYNSMYKVLGNSPREMLTTLLTKPGYVFNLLFENHISDQFYTGIKSELHFSVLCSGGIFLLYRPQFLVMLIPIYLQKLLNSDAARWGINYHYSIEFVPVITACTAVFISDLNVKSYFKFLLAIVMAMVTGFYTYTKLKSRVSIWYAPENAQFYDLSRLTMLSEAKGIHHDLSTLVNDQMDSISVQNALAPHLANRNYIVLFPNTKKAKYIVVAPKTNPYPLKEDYWNCVDSLLKSSYWQLTDSTQNILVFRKRE